MNYSRAFAREVLTFAEGGPDRPAELAAWQRAVVRRHIAFVHALRVFLRQPNGYVLDRPVLQRASNTYEDLRAFLSPDEHAATVHKRNPPNHLLRLQGQALQDACRRGWLTDYRFVQLSETLTEFNNHQGRAERIKNTPLPRPYTVYSRVFVHLHGTLVPFAFVEDLGIFNVPLSISINLVFLLLDEIGHFVEDPFENRDTDVPLTAISRTIEENLLEMTDEPELPPKLPPLDGVVF